MRGCTADGHLNDARYSQPLPWIGLYVAAASLLCAAGMAVDAYSGFRRCKPWFPSRFFSLNATTLTLLGVATKLPVDLNTPMPRRADQLSKLSGTVLICTVMGNLMPSLGTMDDSDILSNVVALGILVVTVAVNICIQVGTGVIYVFLPEHAVIMLLMLVLLVILVSSALVVTTTKQLLEKQYDSKYMLAAADGGDNSGGDIYSVHKLKRYVKKFWLMAHTCSPQYVLGRSATCTASGAFCLLAASVLAEALLRAFIEGPKSGFCNGTSDYAWSTTSVLIAQTVAVVIGTLAPAYRWFNAVGFRSPEGRKSSCKGEFRIEDHWIQRLNEWKEAPLPFHISRRWGRKTAHDLKNWVVALLIRLQTGVVLVSKLVRLISVLPVIWLHRGGSLLRIRRLPSSTSSLYDENVGLKEYVLHLEGEEDLVKLMTRSERKDTEKWMEKGRRNKPAALIRLVNEFSTVSQGFKQVGAFDSDRVRSLVPQPQEPPNCWALPVVTLASIAVALPGADQSLVRSLLRGVSEGLGYVRLVEKNLDAKGLVNMREAADQVWLRVDLYDKWFDLDLRKLAQGDNNGRTAIETVRESAQKCVLEFLQKRKSDSKDHENPLEWPEKVLAANCMYRVSTTILRDYDDGRRTDENLFAWLQRTISDILGACLTNLARVIYMECISSSIEVREQSVRNAASLLGEAEEILRILENPEVAIFFPVETDSKEYIDAWREREQMDPSGVPSSSNKISSDDLCLSID